MKRSLPQICPYALIILLLASCETAPRAGPGVTTRSTNDVVLPSTGFTFPARIGVFTRAGSQRYDANGQDVSVKYLAGALIVADVYDYPTYGKTEGAEFVARKTEIKQYHSDARLLSEGAVTIHPAGQSHRGRRAVFRFSKNFQGSVKPPYQSELLIFQRGSRFVEYRFTYSAAHSETAAAEIENFLSALTWPR